MITSNGNSKIAAAAIAAMAALDTRTHRLCGVRMYTTSMSTTAEVSVHGVIGSAGGALAMWSRRSCAA